MIKFAKCMITLSIGVALVMSTLVMANAQKKVSLEYVFFGSAGDIPVWEELGRDFVEQNPDIKLQVTAIPGETWGEYFDKVIVMVAGGTPPDMMRVAIEGVQLCISKGLLLPLDDYIERDKEELQDYFDDVHPRMIDCFRWEGKIYGLGLEWNNMSIHYNTELFRKYGIDRPADNWDKDEFLSIAEKLTADLDGDGRTDQYGYGLWNAYFAGSMPWIFNFGSNLLTEDWKESNANDPKVIAAMQWLQDLIWKYKVTPAPASADVTNLFVSGKLGMMGGGRWPCLDFANAGFSDYDILYWPKVERQITEVGIGTIPIFQFSEHPEESWKFLKYTLGKEPETYFANLGWCMPARRSVAYDSDIMTPPEHFRIFYDSLDNSKYVPCPPQYNVVENIWLRYLGLITANEMTAAEACQAAHEEISEALTE